MKRIKKLVHHINDELKSADCFAERYIESRMSGENNLASKYKEFALQEMEHAKFYHDLVVNEIEKASQYITVPPAMKEQWEITHNDYVERAARIKSYLQ